MEVEICCNSVLSARNAKLGGAYRIELCQALSEGGTTPSAAAIEYCVKKLNLQTRVLIRPRGGNFIYDNEDFKIALSDIRHAYLLGAHAVVFGFLTPNGDIDVEKTRIAVETAQGMDITFHRAFDECRNPKEALEQIIECGCNKLLTSGCMPSAEEGIPLLKELVKQADGRIGIIAAAGITPHNVTYIVNETKVGQIHASCKKIIDNMTVTDMNTVRNLFKITDKMN
ncbi:MAG: copper homeostasis protein CutC [Bacteroidales bacterium]|nr:copper homeostasis protein CutC [Bacteroidales bacterium]